MYLLYFKHSSAKSQQPFLSKHVLSQTDLQRFGLELKSVVVLWLREDPGSPGETPATPAVSWGRLGAHQRVGFRENRGDVLVCVHPLANTPLKLKGKRLKCFKVIRWVKLYRERRQLKVAFFLQSSSSCCHSSCGGESPLQSHSRCCRCCCGNLGLSLQKPTNESCNNNWMTVFCSSDLIFKRAVLLVAFTQAEVELGQRRHPHDPVASLGLAREVE